VKFGSKFGDATRVASTGGGGGKWIKTLKEGETRMRFLQEVDEWVVYYEHYNPAGTAFPCTGDRDTCPGCTSTNERMKSASRKVAVNAVVGQYQDVYKLPITLVNRLKIKSERNNNTITDRDYLITRIGKDKNTEYDVESGSALPIDLSAYEMLNIEKMLEEQFNENWPDFATDQMMKDLVEPAPAQKQKVSLAGSGALPSQEEAKTPFEQGSGGAPTPAPAPSESPSDEVELTLEQLHGMTPDQLRTLCTENGAAVPDELSTQQEIISWMETQFA
jgi:hypothetical protein